MADEVLDTSRRRDALVRAISELPIGARSVLTLALEGLTHEEIADVLGTTSNSIGVRLSKARADLRSRLGGRT
jgi:RNA polymerase sigma-70 factor (ECF subfamily)